MSLVPDSLSRQQVALLVLVAAIFTLVMPASTTDSALAGRLLGDVAAEIIYATLVVGVTVVGLGYLIMRRTG